MLECASAWFRGFWWRFSCDCWYVSVEPQPNQMIWSDSDKKKNACEVNLANQCCQVNIIC